jgi:hypothetical protein
MSYPDFPGYKPTDTSRAAAKSISGHLGRLQVMSFAAIHLAGRNGLTTDELAATLGMSRASVQPRTSELRRKGRIIDSGQRRRNGSGKSAIVWTAKGRHDD